jgi:hypothetical protein
MSAGPLPGEGILIGLLAEYDRAEALVRGARHVAGAGYTKLDACSPIYVEGVDEALGQRRSRIGLWIFAAGALGAATAFVTQWYATCVSYPYNVGGRPLFSWPSYLAITFELTVLFASFMAFFGWLGFSGLPQLYHPFFNVPAFRRASRDRYFLYVEAADPKYDPVATRHLLLSTEPLEIHEVYP